MKNTPFSVDDVDLLNFHGPPHCKWFLDIEMSHAIPTSLQDRLTKMLEMGPPYDKYKELERELDTIANEFLIGKNLTVKISQISLCFVFLSTFKIFSNFYFAFFKVNSVEFVIHLHKILIAGNGEPSADCFLKWSEDVNVIQKDNSFSYGY